MTLIEWRDEFKVGDDAIDFEHEEMIRLINEAHARIQQNATAQEIEDFLGEAHARISSHFALEEATMRQHGYDEYQDHKADHERLLDGIRDIMDDFESGDYDGLTEDLSRHLQDWFVEHFKTKDSRLHRMIPGA